MTITNGRCNARGCLQDIRHDKLFCAEHWKQVPPGMKLSIVTYYTIGQDSGDTICTPTWIAVVNEAISYLDKIGAMAR